MNPPLDRRSFLGHSLAGLAAASPTWSALAEDAPKKPLRLALVSAASYGAGGQPRTPGLQSRDCFRHDLQRL